MIPRLERLPPPCFSFQPSDGRIICCNNEGHTILYDANSNSAQIMPTLQDFTGTMPISISTGRPGALEENLYVLHSAFHVLRFGPLDEAMNFPRGDHAWHWESLPLPPIDDPVRSHTVVDGGRTICVSSYPGSFGTCCFDTVEREWWHAVSWELPFLGGVEHVPDLDIWLGFSPRKPTTCRRPPAVQQHVLEADLNMPNNWLVLRSNLISLGGGRFCVARAFQEVLMTDGNISSEDELFRYYLDHSNSHGSKFVVLTGVELLVTSTTSDGDGGGGKKVVQGLQIHKFLCYIFTQDEVQWEL
ncbi:hypothetical protein BS78_08G039100 [Paspalum vaginatum]|nr:hypothetical protein BS78_08G039100 [Paspalum vaginatum]